jgi:hypothetical protein
MIYSLPTPVNWTLVLWVQEPQRRQEIQLVPFLGYLSQAWLSFAGRFRPDD